MHKLCSNLKNRNTCSCSHINIRTNVHAHTHKCTFLHNNISAASLWQQMRVIGLYVAMFVYTSPLCPMAEMITAWKERTANDAWLSVGAAASGRLACPQGRANHGQQVWILNTGCLYFSVSPITPQTNIDPLATWTAAPLDSSGWCLKSERGPWEVGGEVEGVTVVWNGHRWFGHSRHVSVYSDSGLFRAATLIHGEKREGPSEHV